jgi:hypothetical protein
MNVVAIYGRMLDLHTYIRYDMHPGNAYEYDNIKDGKEPVEACLRTIMAELSCFSADSGIYYPASRLHVIFSRPGRA